MQIPTNQEKSVQKKVDNPKPLNELERKSLKKYSEKIKKSRENFSVKPKEYSVYGSNFYAKLSNQVMGNLTFYLTTKYDNFFKGLYADLRLSDIKLFSKTYISIILFSTAISFPIITLIAMLFTQFPLALLIGFFGMIATLFISYYYPKSLVNDRSNKIKYDLVFATVHMSAIAESGAQPISMFKLLLDSKEYKYLDPELKKILNYVNLFGYSLTTALRSVAATTPSYEFKELLNGIVSTIETGGDIKSYLKDKSSDTLTQYRLDQERYSAKLSTYSDMYTGILIAAPLLFLVTLAILEKISPTIGSVSISTISLVGTYFVLPLVNILFIVFLNLTKSEF